MEKERKLNLIVVLLNGLFALACVVWLIAILIELDLNTYQIIEAVADLIATTVAFTYLLEGYTKGVSHHYKTSVLVTGLNALVVAILSTGEKIPVVPLIMCIIAFIAILPLALMKNPGKKLSYACCIIVLIIRILGTISIALTIDSLMDPSFSLVITQVSLALMLFVITYAKYTDKRVRHLNS